jgi:hypothetical protein
MKDNPSMGPDGMNEINKNQSMGQWDLEFGNHPNQLFLTKTILRKDRRSKPLTMVGIHHWRGIDSSIRG